MHLNRSHISIDRNILNEIELAFSTHSPECGGILGAGDTGVISEFYFDYSGVCSSNSYSPDVKNINKLLIEDWMPRNIYMVGIIHSHGNELRFPSCGDIYYGTQILQAIDTVDSFYLPIVTQENKRIKIHGYVLYKENSNCCSLPILIL